MNAPNHQWMIAATKYSLSPTSYAHISNYVKQYKCSLTPSVCLSLRRFCMNLRKATSTHVWVKKASLVTQRLQKTIETVSLMPPFSWRTQLSAGFNPLLYAKWWGWIYQERLPPEGPTCTMTWNFLFIKNSKTMGLFVKQLILFFNLTSFVTDCSVPVFVLL